MAVVVVTKKIAIGSLVAAAMLLASGQASAQVIGQSSNNSSAAYGSSVQSDFQNAGYQQSGASAATTAGGVTDALKQPSTGGSLTVTGAAPNQTVDTRKTNKTPLFIFITIAAITGLALIIIYLKKTTKKQTIQEQEFAQEVLTETAVSSTGEDAPSTTIKPKKPKKQKGKSKKHHR